MRLGASHAGVSGSYIGLMLTVAVASAQRARVVEPGGSSDPKLSRDLAQCRAEVVLMLFRWANVKRCMKAKGYRFLRQY